MQEAVDQGGSTHLAGGATAVLSVATAIVATVTISFMTLFMLLAGCRWLQRFFELLPVESAVPRWRHVGDLIYRTIGGYVTGNLLISLVDAVSSTIALLIAGVPTRSLSAYWSRS